MGRSFLKNVKNFLSSVAVLNCAGKKQARHQKFHSERERNERCSDQQVASAQTAFKGQGRGLFVGLRVILLFVCAERSFETAEWDRDARDVVKTHQEVFGFLSEVPVSTHWRLRQEAMTRLDVFHAQAENRILRFSDSVPNASVAAAFSPGATYVTVNVYTCIYSL